MRRVRFPNLYVDQSLSTISYSCHKFMYDKSFSEFCTLKIALVTVLFYFFPSTEISLNASNSQARNKTNFYRSSSNKKELHNEMEIKTILFESFVKDPCQSCFFFPSSLSPHFHRSSVFHARRSFRGVFLLLLRTSQSTQGRVMFHVRPEHDRNAALNVFIMMAFLLRSVFISSH